MTLNRLASQIAKFEGKKHQASIGDIREILKILINLLCDQESGQGVTDWLNAETDKGYAKQSAKKSKAKK